MEHIDFMLECNRDAQDFVGIQLRQLSPLGKTLNEYQTLIQMKELFLLKSILNQNCEGKSKGQDLFELFLESTMGRDHRGKATFPYCVLIPNVCFGNEILTLVKFLDSSRDKKSINFKDPFVFDGNHAIEMKTLEEMSTMKRCPVWYPLLRQMGILCHIYRQDCELYMKGLPLDIQKYISRSDRMCSKMRIAFHKISFKDQNVSQTAHQNVKEFDPSIKRILQSP